MARYFPVKLVQHPQVGWLQWSLERAHLNLQDGPPPSGHVGDAVSYHFAPEKDAVALLRLDLEVVRGVPRVPVAKCVIHEKVI